MNPILQVHKTDIKAPTIRKELEPASKRRSHPLTSAASERENLYITPLLTIAMTEKKKSSVQLREIPVSEFFMDLELM